MYEILKAIAAANGWVFEYGRRDFQNLHDETEQKGVSYLFVDPIEISKNRSDSGQVESITSGGSLMLLYSSDIDEESYEYRYENYIKPIINTQIEIIEDNLICEQEASLEEWKTVEVINMFDFNLDGILLTYRLTIEE